MDLSLLPHLSERALREEAERRGIVAAELERDGLIAAIRQHESRLLTVPPSAARPDAARLDAARPDATRTDATPGPSEAQRSPLRAARSLFGRVVGLARSALDKKSEAPPPAEPEPIRTRSLARLLEDQGHLGRALTIVRELSAEAPSDPELERWAAHLERRIAERALQARVARVRGVEITPTHGLRGVAWSVDEAGIDRGRALLGAEGALTLRVVRVLAHPDRRVESQQEDQPLTSTSGSTLLDAPPNARLIVSVGLSDSERFVSIAHAAG